MEHHSFIYRSQDNSKDFAATPMGIGGKQNAYVNTTQILPFPKMEKYTPWGIAMSEARYDMQMIRKDLGIFRDNNINAIIMTPRAPSGSATAQEPPFYYDAEKHSFY